MPPLLKFLATPLEDIQTSTANNFKPNINNPSYHSKNVERSVKLVLEASRISYGFESRHKGIIAKVLSRNLRPSFTS